MTPAPSPFPAVATLVPHKPPMVLIDRITAAGKDHFSAQVDISEHSLFSVPDCGVPAYVGIEYIAQTIAAYSGWRSQQENPGTPPQLGFLLGTRKMALAESWFPLGATLDIEIHNTFEDGPMAVFDGEILLDGRSLASASISVYQPDDPALAFTS
jgi:predicted hotdog family 3-hydroxylacyl-ACP dehydratase